MEFWIQIDDDGKWWAVHGSDYDTMKKLRRNTPIKINATTPRNPGRHKMYFAMLNMVFQNQEKYNTIDALREEVTIESGYYETRESISGVTQKVAKSISFANMDDNEFNDYYKAVWDVVAKWLDMTDEMIREELVAFM